MHAAGETGLRHDRVEFTLTTPGCNHTKKRENNRNSTASRLNNIFRLLGSRGPTPDRLPTLLTLSYA